jgi:hypothetical protein
VTHCLEAGTPVVFKDHNVINTGLNPNSGSGNLEGEVWKITVASASTGLMTHWLILYPDGRLITSLDDDPERTKINFMTSEVERRNLFSQRAILNNARIDLLTRRDSGALFAAINSSSTGRVFRAITPIGKWDMHDGLLRLNIMDRYRIDGELPGPWWQERTGVSQLVFRKEKSCWVLSQRESKTVWYPSGEWQSRIINSDYPCLLSIRNSEVIAVKIDNFIPHSLPDNWKW